jgi:hypothetical protein
MLTLFVPAALGIGRAIRARMAGAVLLGLWFAVAPVGVARAQDALVGDCIHSYGGLSCALRWGTAGDPYVRRVPGPRDAREEEDFAKHDRNWERRCRPVVKQDQFGIGRYQYAAAGCEFGVED